MFLNGTWIELPLDVIQEEKHSAMKTHAILSLVVLAIATMFTTTVADSQVRIGVGIRIGPPALRREVVYAAPFDHAVWMSGHWRWDDYNGRYVWIRGRWMREEPESAWVEGSWEHAPSGWFWHEGSWQRRHERAARAMDEHRDRREQRGEHEHGRERGEHR